jgi:soluble lytic murein transglycosylase-like protein
VHHLLVLAILYFTHGQGPKCVDADYLANVIEFEAQQNNQDPFLVAAIIANESEFDACAVSHDRKDLGLMQLRTTGAGKGFRRRVLLDPSANVHIGVAYLATMATACKTKPRTLHGYNKGNCKGRLRPYAQHVMKLYRALMTHLEMAST